MSVIAHVMFSFEFCIKGIQLALLSEGGGLFLVRCSVHGSAQHISLKYYFQKILVDEKNV